MFVKFLQFILGIRKSRDGFSEGLQLLKFRRRHHVGLDGGGERGKRKGRRERGEEREGKTCDK
jgi:hypothetical protein